MSEPQQLPSAKGQARNQSQAQASGAGRANLPDAPGLRNLAFLATGLTVAAVVLAVPALRDQGSAATPSAAAPAVTVAQATPAPASVAATPVPIQTPSQAAPSQAAPPPVRVAAAPPPLPVAPVQHTPAPAQTLAAATPQAQAQPLAQPLSCSINPQSLIAPFGDGVITAIEDPQVSLQRIRRIEAATGGAIDPNYIATLRVVVQSPSGAKLTPALPPGLVVHVGDRVTIMSGERNAGLPCNYVPPHVTSDLGPAKPPGSGTPP